MSKQSRAEARKGQTTRPLRRPSQWFTTRDLILGAVLLALLLFVYLPALHGIPVLDDDAHITRGELQSWQGLTRIWFHAGATEEYAPLLHSAFWLEYQLWADDVFYYHLLNILLHALAALLIVKLLRKLELGPAAWIAAYLFAFHPLNVESVAWISEQRNTLSAIFYLAAALAYLRFDKTRLRPDYLTALALFAAALLSKPTTATLPLALLLLLWWKNGKLDTKLDWTRDVRPLAPWLALGLADAILAGWVSHRTLLAPGSHFTGTFAERLLVAGRVLAFDFGKLAWPVNLMFVYPRWAVDPHVAWQWLFPVGALAIGAALWLWARSKPEPVSRALFAAFLFFVITLIPVLGLFDLSPFLYSFVGDHFVYLASLALVIPVAWLLSLAGRKVAAIPAVAVIALALLSWNHSAVFRSPEALYSDTLTRNPESWMAHTNLGLLLSRVQGRTGEAMRHMQDAVRLNPDSAAAHLNLGVFLSDRPGRLPEAIAEYQTALRLSPNYAEAHNDLGDALAEVPGRVPEAIDEYKAALRLDPNYAEAHNNLGSTLSQTGHPEEALVEFEAATADNPLLPEAQANLGVALAKLPTRAGEAIPHLEAALRQRPDMGTVRELLTKMQQEAQAQKQKQQQQGK